MIAFSPSQRIFLRGDSSDMRLGIDGLSNLVVNGFKLDPRSGDLFVFLNARRNRMKILVWDHGGFWLLTKRLEQGRFSKIHREDGRVEMSRTDLMAMLDGIEILRMKKLKRYSFTHKIS